MSDLQRFIDAQDHGTTSWGLHTMPYSTALQELHKGKKVTHWIWYVLPQFPYPGPTSGISKHFSITSIDEAVAYLQNQTLRSRYLETISTVLEHLTSGLSPFDLIGENDIPKLASSVTLFFLTAKSIGDDEVVSVTMAILDRLEYGDCKVDACAKTIDWFTAQSS